MIPYSGPIVTREAAKAAGLKRFFTGVSCRNDHVAERHTSDGKCLECKNSIRRKWSKANAEMESARRKRWRLNHPSSDKEYYTKNRERILEKHQDYYLENKEQWGVYYAQNAEHIKDKQRQRRNGKTKEQRKAEYQKRKQQLSAYWKSDRGRQVRQASKKRNAESIKSHVRNRRARKRAAKGKHTGIDIADIRRMQRDRCAEPSCRCKLHGKGHVDHIIPLARGGANDRRNLQLMCRSCNYRKNAKDPMDFARELGRLL